MAAIRIDMSIHLPRPALVTVQSCVSPKLAIRILYTVIAGIQMRFSR